MPFTELMSKEKIENIIHVHKNHKDGFQVLDFNCPPCAENEIDNECAKLIIQSRITNVIYTDHKDDISSAAAARMFTAAGVSTTHMLPVRCVHIE